MMSLKQFEVHVYISLIYNIICYANVLDLKIIIAKLEVFPLLRNHEILLDITCSIKHCIDHESDICSLMF